MPPPTESRDHKLGTFAGAFTPSILTILGIILFMRLGFVVGQAGIARALLIIVIANVISVLTSLSLSAIATNLQVKGGGDYYIISRTLGVEFGAAIGLVLFLAQSVSIAFYAIGFGEAVAAMLGGQQAWLPQLIAAVAVSAIFVLAWVGADWATRFQYAVMAVLGAAILAFLVGGIPMWSPSTLTENIAPSGDLPFWIVFAIFFPAVTGFTQGVSMSGDLRDPARSLPLGTFAAVFISFGVYVVAALVFAAALPGSELVADYGAMRRVSLFPWLVDAGVIAATLSSALASFLGAPRILQKLAADKVFGWLSPFAVGSGPSENPRRGVLLSAGIAYATIALGNLNLIAPVVSMFFLISYGLLNYATYVEAKANSPYFRPSFRWFHRRLSLLGSLVCLGAMLAIDPVAGVVSVVLLFAIHQFVKRTVGIERWADSDRSHRLQRARADLYAVSKELDHPRNWRPVILAFSDDRERRDRLLRFADWLEGRSGFTTAITVIEGEGPGIRKLQQAGEEELRAEINEQELPAFAKTVVAPDRESAYVVLLQSHGLGRVKANLALYHWYPAVETEYGAARSRVMRTGLRLGVSLVMLSSDADAFAQLAAPKAKNRRIDVWLRDNASGRTMLMLAYLMTRSKAWDDSTLRVLAPCGRNQTPEETRAALRAQLEDYRIPAEVVVCDQIDTPTILEHSAATPMVFLPFRLFGQEVELAFDADIDEVTAGLGVAALVLASEDLQLDAGPESGEHAVIAEALDDAAAAAQRLRRLEKQLVLTEKTEEKAREALQSVGDADLDPDRLSSLQRDLDDARETRETFERRILKARVKVSQAEEAAQLLDKGSSAPNDAE